MERWLIYFDGDNKYNIIWGRDFNTWWVLINNNRCTEATKYIIELPMICVLFFIPHTSYTDWWYMWVQMNMIQYYSIFQLFHVRYIRNDDICGTEQTSLHFIYNSVQLQLFWCLYKYINMKKSIKISFCYISNVENNVLESTRLTPKTNTLNHSQRYW